MFSKFKKSKPKPKPKPEAAAIQSSKTSSDGSEIRPSSPTLFQQAEEAFLKGSSDGIQRVLEEIEAQGQNKVKSGLSEFNFTVGVLNCFLIVYIFAALPQHFWLLYIVEAFVFLPIKFIDLWYQKPLRGVLYLLDYCWCMNYIGVVSLLILAATSYIPQYLHKNLLFVSYGTSCGPLLGAAGALPFVALVFHNFSTMTDVFIHVFPPMLVYTLRWHKDEILQAWPNTFDLDYELNFFPTASDRASIFTDTVCLYFIWLIPYVIWMVKTGVHLPSSKRDAPAVYDTVFHSNMRKGLCELIGTVMWKRPVEESKRQCKTNDFEVRDLFVYLFFHFVGVMVSLLTLAYPCFSSRQMHGIILTSMCIICTYRGALRYTYYSTRMYANIVRKQFLDGDNDDGNSKNKSKSAEVANETTPLMISV